MKCLCRGMLLLFFSLGSLSPAWAVNPARKKEAKALFQEGQKYFKLGRFEKALELYSKAYEVMPLPGLLFNIGQCHRRLGNCEKAIFFYRGYLREMPQAKNRKAVEQLVTECEKKLAEIRQLDRKKREEQEKEAAEQERLREQERQLAEQALALERARAEAAEAAARAAQSNAVQVQTTPFYRKWWFWTIVGAVLSGAAAGTYFAVRPSPAPVNPAGSLGTVVW